MQLQRESLRLAVEGLESTRIGSTGKSNVQALCRRGLNFLAADVIIHSLFECLNDEDS